MGTPTSDCWRCPPRAHTDAGWSGATRVQRWPASARRAGCRARQESRASSRTCFVTAGCTSAGNRRRRRWRPSTARVRSRQPSHAGGRRTARRCLRRSCGGGRQDGYISIARRGRAPATSLAVDRLAKAWPTMPVPCLALHHRLACLVPVGAFLIREQGFALPDARPRRAIAIWTARGFARSTSTWSRQARPDGLQGGVCEESQPTRRRDCPTTVGIRRSHAAEGRRASSSLTSAIVIPEPTLGIRNLTPFPFRRCARWVRAQNRAPRRGTLDGERETKADEVESMKWLATSVLSPPSQRAAAWRRQLRT
jgi:hypothetical protein